MCTFRGDSRILPAVLADDKSHFYMYLELMKRLADNSVCIFQGASRTLSAVLAGDISHFYVYLEIMKRFADNTVCVHSGEVPGHFQQD
jgi:hypothetical protein